MTIRETTLPGLGRKYEIETYGDETFVVVTRHDGRRELSVNRGGSEPTVIATLRDRPARQLGSVLAGIHFEPEGAGDARIPIGDATIEYHDVPADASVAGEALAEAALWRDTGATLLVVEREGETTASPDPGFVVEAGDTLVVVGSEGEQDAVRELLER